MEQSVNYHRFVLEFFTLYFILNNASISVEDKILIEKMYDFLLHIIKPNGKLPLIGDNDDGKVILLTSLKKNHIIDLFNIGSIIFQREDLKYLSKKISITSLLLFGKKGYEIFNKLKSKEPNNTYYYFEKAGYIVIRNNWTEKANYLFVDYGKFGAHTAAHSHSDITNFIYCYRGKEIIIDSGNYTYNKSWNERNYFRRSEAHNILTVNNKNQAKISSWFEWEDIPKIKRKIYFNEGKIILTCFHNGYEGFIVKRQIETNAELSPVIIKDSIIKKKKFFQEQNYYLDIFFHFGENLNVNIKNKKVIIDNELTLEVSSKYPFSLNSKKSFYAQNYGIKKENIMINIHLEPLFDMNDIIEIKTEIKILN